MHRKKCTNHRKAVRKRKRRKRHSLSITELHMQSLQSTSPEVVAPTTLCSEYTTYIQTQYASPATIKSLIIDGHSLSQITQMLDDLKVVSMKYTTRIDNDAYIMGRAYKCKQKAKRIFAAQHTSHKINQLLNKHHSASLPLKELGGAPTPGRRLRMRAAQRTRRSGESQQNQSATEPTSQPASTENEPSAPVLTPNANRNTVTPAKVQRLLVLDTVKRYNITDIPSLEEKANKIREIPTPQRTRSASKRLQTLDTRIFYGRKRLAHNLAQAERFKCDSAHRESHNAARRESDGQRSAAIRQRYHASYFTQRRRTYIDTVRRHYHASENTPDILLQKSEYKRRAREQNPHRVREQNLRRRHNYRSRHQQELNIQQMTYVVAHPDNRRMTNARHNAQISTHIRTRMRQLRAERAQQRTPNEHAAIQLTQRRATRSVKHALKLSRQSLHTYQTDALDVLLTETSQAPPTRTTTARPTAGLTFFEGTPAQIRRKNAWYMHVCTRILITALNNDDREHQRMPDQANNELGRSEQSYMSAIEMYMLRLLQRKMTLAKDMNNAMFVLQRYHTRATSRLHQLQNTPNSQSHEPLLTEAYGGKQCHYRDTERQGFDKSSAQYVTYEQLQAPSNDDAADEEEIEPTELGKYRPCTDACQIPAHWATRLHDAMHTFKPSSMTFVEMQEAYDKFVTCDNCNTHGYINCPVNTCTDTIKLLRETHYHYRDARTLLKDVYRLNRVANIIKEMDVCFESGTFAQLEQLANSDPNKPVRDDDPAFEDRTQTHCEAATLARYKNLIDAFKEAVGAKHYPSHTCTICKRVRMRTQMKVNEEAYELIREFGNEASDIVDDLVEAHIEPGECMFCTDCWTELRGNHLPSLSKRNMFGLDALPAELSDLSMYEWMLVTRVRTIIKTIRLHTLSNKGAPGVVGVRGTALHLAYPMEATSEYIVQLLPSVEGVQFVLNALPKEAVKTITQHVIRWEKVKDAAQWLIKNNKHYRTATMADKEQFLAQLEIAQIKDPVQHKDAYGDMPEAQKDSAVERLDAQQRQALDEQYALVRADKLAAKDKGILDVFQNKRIETTAIGSYYRELDTLSHPYIFPNGTGGSKDPARRTDIQSNKFMNALLNQSDGRARRYKTFLIDSMLAKEQRQVGQGIYSMLNLGTKLSFQQLTSGIINRDENIHLNVNRVHSKVTGSNAYWGEQRRRLTALDEAFGPANLFVTLSCNENDWLDLHNFLACRNKDLLTNNDGSERKLPPSYLIGIDPVSVMDFYMNRFDALMKTVISPKNKHGQAKAGIFGVVDHYFWRLEFQARGAPHIHMKLWIRDAPLVGRDSPETFLKWAQDRYTCRLPDKCTETGLHTLVDKYNTHTCKPKYCHRYKFNKGATRRFCRMGFPRAPTAKAHLLSLKEIVKSRKSKPRQLVQLLRTNDEVRINNYNPALMLAWQGNHDVQAIGEASRVLNTYVTGYINKPEDGAANSLNADLDDFLTSDDAQGKNTYAKLLSLSNKLRQGRELGIYEVIAKLRGYSFTSTDATIVNVTLGFSNERYRKLKDPTQLYEAEENMLCSNILEHYYPARPDVMADLSLYDIFANWTWQQAEPKTERKTYHCVDYKDDNGRPCKIYFKQRDTPAVVMTNYRRTDTEENRERYCFDRLQLYVPWRQEKDLLGNHPSYRAAFDAAMPTISPMADEHAKRAMLERDLELARKWGEEAIENPVEFTPIPTAMDKVHNLCDDIREALATATVSAADMAASLNDAQRRVYDEVIATMTHMHDVHDNKPCTCTPRVLPIRKFVSGVAGTGKSHLINALVAYLTEHYVSTTEEHAPPAVAVLAPTGLSAFNVNGSTIHSFLSIKVQQSAKNSEAPLDDLSGEQRKVFEKAYANIRLYIIDEISMVSPYLLAKIHLRLNEIFPPEDLTGEIDHLRYFGGRSLLLFGDLCQLPPVVKPQVCVFQPLRVGDPTCTRIFHRAGIPNLWSHFGPGYDELTQNMRQQDDPQYRAALDRLRLGNLTVDDIALFESRRIDCSPKDLNAVAQRYLEHYHEMQSGVVALFSTHEQKDAFNRIMLKLDNVQTVNIAATDDYGRHKAVARGRKSSKPEKASETGGLQTELCIGIGARVMLVRNLDTKLGLVNGALGIVTEISHENNKPKFVTVKFDNIDEPRTIEHFEAAYEKSKTIFVTRRQFPLVLAYSLTIHKSQGLTLPCVFVDVATAIHSKAMIYVAVSRTKKLTDLHIIDFDPCRVECDVRAVKEYNRLRRLAHDKLQLPQITDFNQLPPEHEARKRALKNVPKVFDMLVLPLPEDEPTALDERKRRARTARTTTTTTVNTVAKNQHNAMFEALTFTNVRPESCYANASTQALLRCSHIKDALRDRMTSAQCTSTVREALTQLYDLYDDHPGRAVCVDALRASVDARFAPTIAPARTVQHNAFEFIDTLLHHLPPIRRRFHVLCKTQTHYPCCNHKSAPQSDTLIHVVASRHQDQRQTWTQVMSTIETSEQVSTYCSRCLPPGTDTKSEAALAPHMINVSRTTSYTLTAATKYILVQIPAFSGGQMQRRTGAITNFRPTDVHLPIFRNTKFTAKALVLHHGNEANFGHYTAWTRCDDNTWLELDCLPGGRKRSVTKHTRIVPNLADVVLILLERA